MSITNYHDQLTAKSQQIRAVEIVDTDFLGKLHNAANELATLSAFATDEDERQMLIVVCTQLETSCYLMTLGLYRAALSALRLALELGLAAHYYSANKLAHREWKNGATDLIWSTITSPESGVFSQRFTAAFFPELTSHCDEYQGKAKRVYRTLCEYVHGNSETWHKSGLALDQNPVLATLYKSSAMTVVDVVKFAFCCRFLHSLLPNQIDNDVHQALYESLQHVEPIRVFLGGPKEIA